MDYTSTSAYSNSTFSALGPSSTNSTIDAYITNTNLVGNVLNVTMYCTNNKYTAVWAGIQPYNTSNITAVQYGCGESIALLNNYTLVIVAYVYLDTNTISIVETNLQFPTNYTQNTSTSCSINTDCPYGGCCSTKGVCMPSTWNGVTVYDNYNSSTGTTNGTY
jgi:hypothetical protein